MKIIFILLTLIGFIISSAKAQEVGFGIKAGGNISSISGDWNKLPGPFDTIAQYQALFGQFATILDQPVGNLFDVKAKSRFGGHGGIFFNIPVSDNFSIQPEIIFSMKGADFENIIQLSGDSTSVTPIPGFPDPDTITIYFEGAATLNYDISYLLNYIDVPILAKYKFNNGITISAGPYFSFLVSSKFKYAITATADIYGTRTQHSNNSTEILIDTTVTILSEEEDKSKDELNTIQAGFSASLGYEFPFGLGINAGYSGALTELFEAKEDEGFKNSVFYFSLSYRIFNNLFKLE